jgi:hypothetical protein
MKKIIVSLCLIAGISSIASAQNLRVNAYGSYAFDDGIDYYSTPTAYFNGTIGGGFQYGVGLEYMLQNGTGTGIEFKYLHQDSEAPFTYYNAGVKTQTFDLGINYYMLGGNWYFKLDNDMIEPFVGLGGGVANINAKSNAPGGGDGSKTAFAWEIKGGTNIWVGKKIGIKLQADLLSSVAATGGAYFWSYWGPVYATTYSSLYQFSLGGGLVFKLGH